MPSTEQPAEGSGWSVEEQEQEQVQEQETEEKEHETEEKEHETEEKEQETEGKEQEAELILNLQGSIEVQNAPAREQTTRALAVQLERPELAPTVENSPHHAVDDELIAYFFSQQGALSPRVEVRSGKAEQNESHWGSSRGQQRTSTAKLTAALLQTETRVCVCVCVCVHVCVC